MITSITSMTSSNQTFTLHYWPVIPGRGEFIRLAFESVKHPYKENNETATKAFPYHFAVPLLEIGNSPNVQDTALKSNKSQKTKESQDVKSSKSDQSIFISQTAAILSYLAPILELDGVKSLQEEDQQSIAIRRAQVLQLTATLLDLNNEVHDTHHPISSAEVYEDQKEEAARRAQDLRKNRIPKFFTHFQTVLQNNSSSTDSGWLIGNDLTIADLTFFQVVDGLHFAFPKRIDALKKQGKHSGVFNLYQKVAQLPNIANYLNSDRRKVYRRVLPTFRRRICWRA